MRTTLTLLILLLMIVPPSSWAIDIEGRVLVMDRQGQTPLKSHAHVVVYIEGFSTEPNKLATMDQQDKKFVPRLLPVVSGQPIRFTNSDIFQHSVFSPHAKEPFDLSRYRQGESRTVVLHEIGPHTIYCNIHQNMIADVFVVPNQYFALTDDDGSFHIANVPQGDHRLTVWHILGGEASRMVHVGTKAPFIALKLQSRRSVVERPKPLKLGPQDNPYDDITNYDY